MEENKLTELSDLKEIAIGKIRIKVNFTFRYRLFFFLLCDESFKTFNQVSSKSKYFSLSVEWMNSFN